MPKSIFRKVSQLDDTIYNILVQAMRIINQYERWSHYSNADMQDEIEKLNPMPYTAGLTRFEQLIYNRAKAISDLAHPVADSSDED